MPLGGQFRAPKMGIQMPEINSVPISLREQSTVTKALQGRWETGYIDVLVRLNVL